MEEVDRPRYGPLHYAACDLLFGEALPAEGVHCPHNVVGVALRVDVRVHRIVVVAVRRAEERLRAYSCKIANDILGSTKLIEALFAGRRRGVRRESRERTVRPGVVDKVVPLVRHA